MPKFLVVNSACFSTMYQCLFNTYKKVAHSVDGVVECRECDYTASIEIGLDQHLFNTHKKVAHSVGGIVDCRECDCTAGSEIGLEEHTMPELIVED